MYRDNITLPCEIKPVSPIPDKRLFPQKITIEDISLSPFDSREAFLKRLVYEAKQPGKSICLGLNAHNANMAHKYPFLKQLYQAADLVYCDGAGVIMAAMLTGKKIKTRLANGDWFFQMWNFLADNGCTIYYLGSEPGIVDKGVELYEKHRKSHTVVGIHHGYILNDKSLEAKVIAEINRLKPDVLFVGFGCPLQEQWILDHMDELDVSLFYAIGASMDYVVGKKPRCPEWLGNLGGEWLFRLFSEPKRLYHRYLVGNPWFLFRVTGHVLKNKLSNICFDRQLPSVGADPCVRPTHLQNKPVI